MAGKVMNTGYSDDFLAWLAGVAPPAMYVRLFTNNYTPAITSVLANFTELSGVGYSAYALTPGLWTTALVSGIEYANYPGFTYVFTGACTIYGYFVTDGPSASKVEFAEAFSSGPYTFGSGGGGLYLTLQVAGPSS